MFKQQAYTYSNPLFTMSYNDKGMLLSQTPEQRQEFLYDLKYEQERQKSKGYGPAVAEYTVWYELINTGNGYEYFPSLDEGTCHMSSMEAICETGDFIEGEHFDYVETLTVYGNRKSYTRTITSQLLEDGYVYLPNFLYEVDNE